MFVFGIFLNAILATNTIYAQNTYEYTVLAPLPGTTEARCDPGTPEDPACKTTLQRYLPGIFNLAIGLSAVFAVLMIVIGGFQYISTDAIMKKEDGKKRIQNAVLGLVFVISAWLILYTINPNLLTLNLNIQPATTSNTTGQSGNLTTGNAISGGEVSGIIRPSNVAVQPCPTCVRLSSGTLNIQTNDSAAGTGVEAGFAQELSQFSGHLVDSGMDFSEWRVTEAWPPTVNHVAQCHQVGTCVDARPIDQTPENINRFFTAASQSGIRAVYEVQTEAQATALRDSGVNGRILVVTSITGPHFSLYKE